MTEDPTTTHNDAVNFYVKTRKISGDRRVEKEWATLRDQRVGVNLIYAANDALSQNATAVRQVKRIRLPGGAAPRNLVVRLLGALLFSFNAYFRALLQPRVKVHWVNDPILFPLVLLLSLRKKNYVIWDHHELPPDWAMTGALIKYFFATAYKRAALVIHTNQARCSLLESALKYQHENNQLLPNYPLRDEMHRYKEVVLNVADNQRFIYLQNSFGEKRCDLEIFSAIKAAGLRAVHAGSIDPERKAFIEKQIGPLEFCDFVGHRDLDEINWLLRKSIGTLIFYKRTSANNWLCDPNRLYQAKAQGAWIICGHNPTLKKPLAGYQRALVIANDGSDSQLIADALNELTERADFAPEVIDEPAESLYWNSFAPFFQKVAIICNNR
ncbi:hypothetical protein [Pseudidiomarina salilacus]|uniref:hypothetical protein n=1 Tax=Pseudidiomarina salilacus TaxID=3384452 RepID=UPI003984EF5A